MSPVLEARFSGPFADAAEAGIDATDFEAPIVRAVVEFAYLGSCTVECSSLGALFCLADLWQFSMLSDAIERCWASLPLALNLETLAGLSQEAPIPPGLTEALLRIVASGLERAVSDASGPPETALQVNGISQLQVNWRVVRELHHVLGRLAPEEMTRLRGWVEKFDDKLGAALEDFTVTCLRDLARASSENLARLCSRPLKARIIFYTVVRCIMICYGILYYMIYDTVLIL